MDWTLRYVILIRMSETQVDKVDQMEDLSL
jgi:hypothetical protein